MQDNLARNKDFYTFEDYLSWDDGQRWELIDGQPYLMAAPNEEHHDISMALSQTLSHFLLGKPCKLFTAPFDVRLFPHKTNKREQGLVQPDLFVVCDKSKRDGQRINGAPDLVIEILSPGNESHDRYKKLNLYIKAGVREYWIVDPKNLVIQVYIITAQGHNVFAYEINHTLSCEVLPGLEIALSDIFPTTEG
ncbi:MAG: Uma2 family endonuclease [Oscillospiraceae bacterium]|nr:Uma2 family endonuclease [Oscillospiraceae bacterium]